MSETIILAVGGNALAPEGHTEHAGHEERARSVARTVVGLLNEDRTLIIVHGNGPQVGTLALAHESIASYAPPQPLFVLSAMTQGQLGQLLAQAIDTELEAAGERGTAAALMTQVVVHPDDPAFQTPSKPIGPFFSEGRARRLSEARGWDVAEDAGRGWRRVVPSPRPVEIVEAETLTSLVARERVVIAGGGGGVPVSRDGDGLHGVEAVIDKDFSAALIGELVDADLLLLLTGVDQVLLDFGTPEQRAVDRMTVAEARAWGVEGQFPAGSMGPKVAAAAAFVENSARQAVITSLDATPSALAGEGGTRIVA